LLVCAQLLIYYQRFNLPKECIKACYEYCKDYEEELEDSYRQKVFVEFVKAMNEATSEDTAESTGDPLNANDDGDNSKVLASDKNDAAGDSDYDDEEEDAVMEEMLNAEKGGYGEFADDYDELDEEEGKEQSGDFDEDDEEEDEDDDDENAGLTLFGKRDVSADQEDSTTRKRAKPSNL
jgi:hypothetical protein